MQRVHVNQCWKLFVCLSLLVILCSQVYHWNWKALDFKGHVSLRSVAAENKTRCIGYGKPWELENNKCEKRFPNTLIIGVTKGGTFALMWFLSQHPQIVHNHDINEYFFFAKNYQKGLQWYKENMPYSLPGQVVIDKSANYFAQKETPARVFQLNPSMKCILSVRHPVKRAISEYAMHKYNHEKRIKTVPHVKFGEPFPPFEKIWKRYLWFYYDTSLENWLKFFSLEQIHIVDSDAFSKSPVKELNKIEMFLNIDQLFDKTQFYFNSSKGFYCLNNPRFNKNEHCLGEWKGRKHSNLSASIFQTLKDIFRPHNERFYQLSGKHFDWDD